MKKKKAHPGQEAVAAPSKAKTNDNMHHRMKTEGHAKGAMETQAGTRSSKTHTKVTNEQFRASHTEVFTGIAFGTKIAASAIMPNPALDSFIAALVAKVVPIGILGGIFGPVLARQARRLLHPRKRAFKCESRIADRGTGR